MRTSRRVAWIVSILLLVNVGVLGIYSGLSDLAGFGSTAAR